MGANGYLGAGEICFNVKKKEKEKKRTDMVELIADGVESFKSKVN